MGWHISLSEKPLSVPILILPFSGKLVSPKWKGWGPEAPVETRSGSTTPSGGPGTCSVEVLRGWTHDPAGFAPLERPVHLGAWSRALEPCVSNRSLSQAICGDRRTKPNPSVYHRRLSVVRQRGRDGYS